MAIKVGTAVQDRQANSLGGSFYGGGSLNFYTGTQPATADTSPTGTLLCSLTLPATPFASASGGSPAAKSGTWSGTVVANGDAGWFRQKTSAGTNPIDGSVTETGGGGDIELDEVTVAIGDIITLSAITLGQPAS